MYTVCVQVDAYKDDLLAMHLDWYDVIGMIGEEEEKAEEKERQKGGGKNERME